MPLTPERIRHLPQRDKVVPYDDMGRVIRQLTAQEVPVFLAQGVFDVVHVGHVDI